GGVGVQRHAGQGQAVALEAADQLGNEVLGVGGGAAIAAGENLVVVGQGGKEQLHGDRERLCQFSCAGLEGVGSVVEVRRHVCGHVHSADYLIFPCAFPLSCFHEGVSNPLQAAVFFADHIKAAGWEPPGKVATGQRRQKIAGGPQQALLLAAVYTGGSPAVAGAAAEPHFHEDQHRAVEGDQVDFPRTAQQI